MDPQNKKRKLKKGLPWWLYLLFAILSYYLLKYYIPDMAAKGSVSNQLVQLAGHIAPILTIVFLLLAANELYKGDRSNPEKEDEPEEDQ